MRTSIDSSEAWTCNRDYTFTKLASIQTWCNNALDSYLKPSRPAQGGSTHLNTMDRVYFFSTFGSMAAMVPIMRIWRVVKICDAAKRPPQPMWNELSPISTSPEIELNNHRHWGTTVVTHDANNNLCWTKQDRWRQQRSSIPNMQKKDRYPSQRSVHWCSFGLQVCWTGVVWGFSISDPSLCIALMLPPRILLWYRHYTMGVMAWMDFIGDNTSPSTMEVAFKQVEIPSATSHKPAWQDSDHITSRSMTRYKQSAM